MTQSQPYQPEIAARMDFGEETKISSNAQFYQTANGYWIAWQPEVAAVLPPDLPNSEPCDRVEGGDSLAELTSLIESGDYEALLAEDAAHEHKHEGCTCGCAHG